MLIALLALAPRQPRIVVLAPSFAEDLCAMGAGAQIAGVSDYTSDIPCVKGVPQVNNFAAVDAERILTLHPDVVLALPYQRKSVAPLERAGLHVEYVADDSYADIFRGITRLGELSGHRAQAAQLNARLRAQTAALQRKAHYRFKPRVLFVEQAMPLWTIGPHSFIARLISLAGGTISTSDLKQTYAQYSTEAVLRSDPDAIVATDDARLPDVLAREPWRSLRAVRQHHVFILSNSSIIVRPGPRYVQGLQWLIARFSSL